MLKDIGDYFGKIEKSVSSTEIKKYLLPPVKKLDEKLNEHPKAKKAIGYTFAIAGAAIGGGNITASFYQVDCIPRELNAVAGVIVLYLSCYAGYKILKKEQEKGQKP